MLSEISQRKISTTLFHFSVESNGQNELTIKYWQTQKAGWQLLGWGRACSGGEGKGIEQKKERKRKISQTQTTVWWLLGRVGVGGGGGGYTWINKWCWMETSLGVGHTTQCTDMLSNCAPETCIILVTSVTPINSIKRKINKVKTEKSSLIQLLNRIFFWVFIVSTVKQPWGTHFLSLDSWHFILEMKINLKKIFYLSFSLYENYFFVLFTI